MEGDMRKGGRGREKKADDLMTLCDCSDVSECPSFTDRSMHLVLKMAKRLQALCTSYTK